jgi:hypothetical protein
LALVPFGSCTITRSIFTAVTSLVDCMYKHASSY